MVTGALGQLGRALLEAAAARGLSAEGHDLDTLDITDADAVSAAVARIRPHTVVNCAAWTAVDDCEANPDLALAVNGTAVGHLAAACAACGATLVQVSTDYVFSGAGERPLREDDPVGPASAYGRGKLEGERLARQAPEHLVVRTAWLFGRGGRSFVTAIRDQVEAGAAVLRVVADQRGCPTYGDDLAEAILGLLACGARGTVHAVNSGATTWHGFAEEIVRQLGAEVEVRPVRTADVPRPAPRPANSVLDTARLTALLGAPMPPWQDGLRRYLEAR
jgi:dTDP-4-dehydrorhamnose reductase